MNCLRAAALIVSICLSPFICTDAFAQSAAELSQKTTTYQQSIASKKEALVTVENRLLAYDVKREDAKNQLVEAKEDLLVAQSELETAKQISSDDGPRKLEMSQRRLELAERGVQNREKRLDRLNRKHSELIAEKGKLEADIAWIDKQIVSLNKTAEAQRAEEEKFAAMQAAATPEPVITTPEPVISTPAPRPPAVTPTSGEGIESAEALDKGTIAETVDSKPAEDKVETDQADKATPVEKANLTPHQRYARNEIKKLNERTRNADKSEHRRYSELLLDIDYKHAVELEYLGNEQFFAEVELSKGKHTLIIDMRKFIVKVPDGADGDTFVVIYDTTDMKKPRFVFFNKQFLH